MAVPAALGFGLAVLPICLTPGVSFTLVTQRVATGGRGAGVRVVVGTAAGLVCHAALAAIGLATLVMRSSEAFTTLKLVGALYLVWLGVTTLRRSGRAARTALPWSGRGDLVQGFLGNVLNPKAAAVYLTLAPQSLHRGEPVVPQLAVLVAVHIVVAASWLLIWAVFVDVARRVVTGQRFRLVADRVTGSVLVAFGLRTAVAR